MAVRDRGSHPAGRYRPPGSTRGFLSTISASDGTGLKDTDTGPTVGREWQGQGLEGQEELSLAVLFWGSAPPRPCSETSQNLEFPITGTALQSLEGEGSLPSLPSYLRVP